MTDKELKALVEGLAIAQAKTDEQLRETDKQLKVSEETFSQKLQKSEETFSQRLQKSEEAFNKRIKKLEELVGNIGNNQGDVAEEYFVNSLYDSLELAGMHFDTLLKNVGMRQKGIRDEFDILLVNGESVALIEVKYKVHPNILERLPKKIAHLKQMPQYKNYKVYAGIAGFFIPDEVIKEANKRGYFVLQRKGDVVVTYADHLVAA